MSIPFVRLVKRILKWTLPLLILASAGLAAGWLISTRPRPARVEPIIEPTLVDVIEAKKITQRIKIRQNGTVVAAQCVTLRPEVSGRIIWQSPELVPGGRLSAGDVILQIDPREYEYTVEQRKLQVQDAIVTLKEEKGRQVIGKREWDLNLLGDGIQPTEIGRELALRIPHLLRAEAALAAATSALKKAELDLERTTIRAPFNAFVQTESVDIGQVVNPQTEIATLIGTDRFWVQVSIPVEQLQWILIPGINGGGGSRARVVLKAGDTLRIERAGRVDRLVGDIDVTTRMARLLLAVDDPLALKRNSGDPALPLLIGAWVDVEIEGVEVKDVFALPWQAIREGNRVWIMEKDSTLGFRDIDIIKKSADDTVIVGSGLNDGDLVVVSRISAPVPGMALRTGRERAEQVVNKLESRKAPTELRKISAR